MSNRRDPNVRRIGALQKVASWFSQRPTFSAWALCAMVLAVFLPTLRNAFIWYDDNGYVIENAWVQQGLTWSNILHAFRTTEIAYWHPLTWISHLIDLELFGLKPWGHHLTSVVLHSLNAGLLFIVFRKSSGAFWPSLIVAALFGLHPLHVESVAWVAERKDVLSTFFWLTTLWTYTHWTTARGIRRSGPLLYSLAVLSFFAALMSKPMVVTLPCVLLLLDIWPLQRWGLVPVMRLFAEKLPLFVLSAIASFATVHAQAALGTVQSVTQFSWKTRIANALVSYLRYLEKCFYPVDLAVFYPHAPHAPVGSAVMAGLVLLLVSTLAVTWRKRRPYVFIGWLWFLGTLVPVIGIVQVGGQAMADRYSYVPLIGIFIIVAWGLAEVANRSAKSATVVSIFAATTLLLLTGATERQLHFWRNTETLFQHALAVTPDSVTPHMCLGYYYAKSPERIREAIAEYRRAVALGPNVAETHFSLAAMLARIPEGLPEAIGHYRIALQLNPAHTRAAVALASALEQLPGRESETISAYAAALQLDPANADAHNRLGNLLAQVPDRLPEAIAHYREALRLRPDWIEVHLNLGAALAELPGRTSDAIAEYETVLRVKPDFAEVHNNLANTLAALDGHEAEAMSHFEAALRLRPDYFEAHFNFGQLLARFPERRSEALAHFEAALRIKPDLAPAREMIEQLRATR